MSMNIKNLKKKLELSKKNQKFEKNNEFKDEELKRERSKRTMNLRS
jgi:hypothetical protein